MKNWYLKNCYLRISAVGLALFLTVAVGVSWVPESSNSLLAAVPWTDRSAPVGCGGDDLADRPAACEPRPSSSRGTKT